MYIITAMPFKMVLDQDCSYNLCYLLGYSMNWRGMLECNYILAMLAEYDGDTTNQKIIRIIVSPISNNITLSIWIWIVLMGVCLMDMNGKISGHTFPEFRSPKGQMTAGTMGISYISLKQLYTNIYIYIYTYTIHNLTNKSPSYGFAW